jgi:WD40 repeat protein
VITASPARCCNCCWWCCAGSSDNVVRLWHARCSTDGSTLLDPAEASAAAADAGISAGDMGLAESLLLDMDGPTDSDDQATASDQTPGLTAAAVNAVNANSSGSISRRHAGHGPYSVITGEADEGMFDLSLPGQYLRGHIGPVTSLCMTDSCLYSGSWDYSVRVWRRGTWDCVRCVWGCGCGRTVGALGRWEGWDMFWQVLAAQRLGVGHLHAELYLLTPLNGMAARYTTAGNSLMLLHGAPASCTLRV